MLHMLCVNLLGLRFQTNAHARSQGVLVLTAKWSALDVLKLQKNVGPSVRMTRRWAAGQMPTKATMTMIENGL